MGSAMKIARYICRSCLSQAIALLSVLVFMVSAEEALHTSTIDCFFDNPGLGIAMDSDYFGDTNWCKFYLYELPLADTSAPLIIDTLYSRTSPVLSDINAVSYLCWCDSLVYLINVRISDLITRDTVLILKAPDYPWQLWHFDYSNPHGIVVFAGHSTSDVVPGTRITVVKILSRSSCDTLLVLDDAYAGLISKDGKEVFFEIHEKSANSDIIRFRTGAWDVETDSIWCPAVTEPYCNSKGMVDDPADRNCYFYIHSSRSCVELRRICKDSDSYTTVAVYMLPEYIVNFHAYKDSIRIITGIEYEGPESRRDETVRRRGY